MPHSVEWLKHLDDEAIRAARVEAAHAAAYRVAHDECERLDNSLSSIKREIVRLHEAGSALWSERCYAHERMCQLQVVKNRATGRRNNLNLGRLPVQDFPADILRLIFVEAAQNDPYRLRWVVRAVCSQWRDVVESTPSLWSHIRIHFTQPEEQLFRSTKHALSYGGTYPLHLELLFDPPLPPFRHSDPVEESNTNQMWEWWSDYVGGLNASAPTAWGHADALSPEVELYDIDSPTGWGVFEPAYGPHTVPGYEYAYEYLELIIAHCGRWHTLIWRKLGYPADVRAWEGGWVERKLRDADLAGLQHFEVDLRAFTKMGSTRHVNAMQNLSASATNLTSVSLRGSLVHPIASTLLVHLAVEACETELDTLLSLIHSHPSLRSFRLHQTKFRPNDLVWPTANQETLPTIVTLPVLRTISMKWSGQDDPIDPQTTFYGALLSRLLCPELRSANIESRFWTNVLSDIISFFNRSPQLTHLALTLASKESLEPIFQALCSVETFVGRWQRKRPADLKQFFSAASSIEALPSLKRLSFPFACSADQLLPWMKDRAMAGSGLEMFHCPRLSTTWTEEELHDLKSLVEIREPGCFV